MLDSGLPVSGEVVLYLLSELCTYKLPVSKIQHPESF